MGKSYLDYPGVEERTQYRHIKEGKEDDARVTMASFP